MKTTLLTFFTVLSTLFLPVTVWQAIAQNPPPINWEQNYGGRFDDHTLSMQQTHDGGYIIAGGSKSDDNDVVDNYGDYDVWVVKTDACGSVEWAQNYGGSEWDAPYAIRQTTDLGYIIVGVTASDDIDVSQNPSPGVWSVWVLKLDPSGGIQWEHTYGGSDRDYATDVWQTTDGGYVVAGTAESDNGDVSQNPSPGVRSVWILKLAPDGLLQWERTYGGSDEDVATAVQQTVDGGYIVAGWTDSNDGDVVSPNPSPGIGSVWVIKLANNSTIQWERAYGGSNIDGANDIRQTTDGGYIVAGGSRSNDGHVSGNNGNADFWLLKLDPGGAYQWDKNYGGNAYDWALSIQQTTDDGYIVAGWSSSNNGDVGGNYGSNDYWLVKTDVFGNMEWEQNYGGSDSDVAVYVQETTDGGYIVGGGSRSNDHDVGGNYGDWDYWIVKLGGGWPRTYGGGANPGARRFVHDMVVDEDDNVYTIGHVQAGVVSHEDPGFGPSPDRGFLMKHNACGHLVWAEYFDVDEYDLHNGWLKLANDKLIVLSATGYLHGFNSDGSAYFPTYNFGSNGYALDIDNNTGEIYVAAFSGSTGVGIYRFNTNGTLQSQQNITGNAVVTGMAFSESLNRLFVSGDTDSGGTATFPGGQTITDAFFGAEFDTGGLSIAFSPPAVNFGANHIGLLAFDDNTNRLYADRNTNPAGGNANIYRFNGGFGVAPSLVYSGPNLTLTSDLYFHQSENVLFATFGVPDVSPQSNSNHEIAKMNHNGAIWNIPLPHAVSPQAIAKGSGDHVYVGGHYFGSEILGTFPIDEYNSPSSISLFKARIMDYGTTAEFKTVIEDSSTHPVTEAIPEKNRSFVIYPNPVEQTLHIEGISGESIRSLSLRGLSGTEVRTRKNLVGASADLDMELLPPGFYILQVEKENGEREFYRVVKK